MRLIKLCLAQVLLFLLKCTRLAFDVKNKVFSASHAMGKLLDPACINFFTCGFRHFVPSTPSIEVILMYPSLISVRDSLSNAICMSTPLKFKIMEGWINQTNLSQERMVR